MRLVASDDLGPADEHPSSGEALRRRVPTVNREAGRREAIRHLVEQRLAGTGPVLEAAATDEFAGQEGEGATLGRVAKLDEARTEVQAAALLALARLRTGPVAGTRRARLLTDRDEPVARLAARLIELTERDPAAVDETALSALSPADLIRRWGDSEKRVRAAVPDALGQMGRSALDSLLAVPNSATVATQCAALELAALVSSGARRARNAEGRHDSRYASGPATHQSAS